MFEFVTCLADAIFSVSGSPVLAEMADSKEAGAILDELQVAVEEGFESLQLQRVPHISLLSKSYYE